MDPLEPIKRKIYEIREMLREYAMLRSRFGKGESACMAYCLFTPT